MKQRSKIIICLIILIVAFVAFLIEIKSFKNKTITYTKVSNVNFITHLKDNNYYDSKYLKNEYNLVASLVDYFNIDYNYSYTLQKKVNYELNYSIDAVLEIYDSDNSDKPIEKRNYIIEEKKTIKDSSQVIKVDMTNEQIKYSEYSSIVDKWKKEVSPTANLRVSIKVDWKSTDKRLQKELNDNTVTEFVIPISKKTIDIKIPKNINEKGKIKLNNKLPFVYILIIFSTLLLFVVSLIYLFVNVTSINKTKSKYDQKISKLLREFDRAITEAKGKFTKVEGEKYIEVTDFMELLDVHDNVNEPIIYYKNSNDLSVFVVKNGENNYFTKIKRNDFDE